MALKDHVTDSAKLKEEEIEAIIADLIKYDPTNKTVVFLPKAQNLSVEKKILLYLVALRGWKFLIKENPPTGDASPKEIEQVTGVSGGTIRPALRNLVQSKTLISRKGRYEMPAHNLSRVRDVMLNSNKSVHPQIVVSTKKKIKKSSSSNKSIKKTGKKNSSSKPSLAIGFKKLITEGWFKSGKTTYQLKGKLDEMTVFPPMSHLPVHLLKAYRDGLLTRIEKNINGKNVWVYSTK